MLGRAPVVGAVLVALVLGLTTSVSAGPPATRLPRLVTVLDDFSDFRNNVFTSTMVNRWRAPNAPNWTALGYTGEAWPSGGGLRRVSTRYGPGFRFTATDEMSIYSGAK